MWTSPWPLEDAVWGKYLHPKWAEQKLRLHGAQKGSWSTTSRMRECQCIGTQGGWGAKAVLQACRKVVERPNSGKPTDRVKGKVVTVDEFRTSWVSAIMNSPQPCEEELDRSKPTRPEGWKPQPASRGGPMALTGAALVATSSKGSCPSKEYPGLGSKKLQDQAPKAQAQQPLAQESCQVSCSVSMPGFDYAAEREEAELGVDA
ncbi:hypothetical protein QJQ45_019895 [Haematococcus lacustris]|nr:hypothetical protein QJQ45_019895 [Haematococcus lacustris]